MANKNIFRAYKLHHLLFWAALFGAWYYFRFQDYPTRKIAVEVTFLKVADLALMIYITNYLLIPKLLYRKKYSGFALVFFIMVLTSSISKMYLIGKITGRPDLFSLSENFKSRMYDNVIPHFFLVIAGAAFKLLLDYIRAQQRMVELVKEKAGAELNFLKSQINPHFLFNSLNTVYFLIEKSNASARQALHKFSEMLRYQLYEAGGEKIPVEKEMDYLRDYVGLQQLRKDDNYSVQFNCSTDVKGFFIEPLLLIPFVENAFKYISHHSGSINYIDIDISREKGIFRFFVENSREAVRPSANEPGGIGLSNVKRRLELLYPGKHELNLIHDDQKYQVELKIRI